MCRQAAELVARSREVRGGIQELIVSIETQKTQAHGRVTSSVAQSVQEANSKKVKRYKPAVTVAQAFPAMSIRYTANVDNNG